ncbi:MAG: LuxR C-terminal-related transcriptional regulator [Anaerolineae bacterium]
MTRSRLIDRLNDGLGLGHRLTLISAPAGFGKTTLLSEWASHAAQPAAWLSLDESDNHLTRFLSYLVAALQQVEPHLGRAIPETLRAPQPPPVETLITSLINQINALTGDLILVLDDYHLVTSSQIHQALGFLLKHQPNNLHLVIATRADPPLPLARLRGRRQLTELRQAQLRFTAEEAAIFLKRLSGLDLSAGEIAALEERTEGWITGLQLAALSMRGCENVSGFVSSFSGSHRYVLDYLTEEVLLRQPEEIREFLLSTSLLERLSAPLCDAVLATDESANERINKSASERQDTSQAILEHLEAANLFVVSLDDQRVWYRYHRLFADLLRARLEELHPDRVPHLHHRASVWYEQEAMLDEAMKHAIASGDQARAAQIVESHGRSLLMHGELTTLLRWISDLPEETIQTSAVICINHAWALLLTGQLNGIEERLQQVEKLLEGHSKDPRQGDIAVIRAYRAAQEGDVARTVDLARLALERLPPSKQGERGVAFFVLAGAHLMAGDWGSAKDAFAQAAAVGQQGENLHIAVPALNSLADIQALQGHLHQAQRTAREAVDLVTGTSGQPLPIAAGALSALAELAYEWNDLDEALAYASRSLDLGRLWGNSDTLGISYLTLAEILAAHGRLHEAQDVFREAERFSQEASLLPTFFPRLQRTRVRLWLARGDLAAAAAWAKVVTFDPRHPVYAETSLALARVHLALGNPGNTLQILSPLLEMARTQNLTSWLIEGLALQALAHHAQRDEEQALATLTEALTLAQPGGYVRRFVDIGPAMLPLLKEAAARGIVPDDLLAALGDVADRPKPSPAQPLIEPLSDREIEVLSLVAQGLSNREVGRRLHIAESTVKSHLNNVYGKLGVDNRTQAAAKARTLNIIS